MTKLYLLEFQGQREEQTYTLEELKVRFLQNNLEVDNDILDCSSIGELTKALVKHWIFGYTFIELN